MKIGVKIKTEKLIILLEALDKEVFPDKTIPVVRKKIGGGIDAAYMRHHHIWDREKKECSREEYLVSEEDDIIVPDKGFLIEIATHEIRRRVQWNLFGEEMRKWNSHSFGLKINEEDELFLTDLMSSLPAKERNLAGALREIDAVFVGSRAKSRYLGEGKSLKDVAKVLKTSPTETIKFLQKKGALQKKTKQPLFATRQPSFATKRPLSRGKLMAIIQQRELEDTLMAIGLGLVVGALIVGCYLAAVNAPFIWVFLPISMFGGGLLLRHWLERDYFLKS